MAIYDQCCKAVKKHHKNLRRLPNVKGVVVAKKIVGGHETAQWGVTVFVERKLPLSEIAIAIPASLRVGLSTVPTDVIQTGVIKAYDAGDRKLWHPIVDGGISMGHRLVTAGTLGGFVRHRTRPETIVLTNNHVGAATNQGVHGDRWYNPGPFDQGTSPGVDPPLDTAFAQLFDFEFIQFRGQPDQCSAARGVVAILNFGVQLMNFLIWGPLDKLFGTGYSVTKFIAQDDDPVNVIDAAIGTLDREDKFSNKLLDAENKPTIKVPGTAKFKVGDLVAKSGRTTEWTDFGIVFAVDGILEIEYGPVKIAIFKQQVLTRNASESDLREFSAPGDSGSWILKKDTHELGALLFAGGDNLTVGNPIDEVFSRLDIVGVA